MFRTRCHDKFCRGILWPLFHYLMPSNDSKFGAEYEDLWNAYSRANMLVAKKSLIETENEVCHVSYCHGLFFFVINLLLLWILNGEK